MRRTTRSILVGALLAAVAALCLVLTGAAPAIVVADGEPVPDGRYRFAVKLTMTGIPTAGGGRRAPELGAVVRVTGYGSTTSVNPAPVTRLRTGQMTVVSLTDTVTGPVIPGARPGPAGPGLGGQQRPELPAHLGGEQRPHRHHRRLDPRQHPHRRRRLNRPSVARWIGRRCRGQLRYRLAVGPPRHPGR